MEQTKIVEAITNNLPIVGNFTFVTSADEDFESLKDAYSIPPEINMFAVVHSIDNIITAECGESIDEAGERMLENYEAYLIPSQYKGYICYAMDFV